MKKTRSVLILMLILCLAAGLLSGCAQQAAAYFDVRDMGLVTIEDEAVALAAAPAAIPVMLLPEASGKSVKEKNNGSIDYSNIKDGYVMAQFTAATEKRLKVQIVGPTTTYSYNLKPQEWATFPLSDGNGEYKVSIFKNAEGSKYSSVVSVTFTLELTDEFAPFLRPNQFVDYEHAEKTIAKAAELTEGKESVLDKVEAVYDYVIGSFGYDDEKAATVESTYVPDLDDVLEKQGGICFDYAAVMAGMLRSQGIPVKLVVGYAEDIYHAWISVFSEKDGWVDGAVFFDGKTWMRMDPTFASTGGNTQAIKDYIGNGNNYAARYFY